MLTAAAMKSLPIPSESQFRAFADHLVSVHSWYKHLPLFGGGEFIVFLAPDAGENYPTQHPKLPTTNSMEGYRLAFGHLDYIWRSRPTEPFDRDGSRAPQLDDEIASVSRFNLYPFVCHDFYWSVHKDDVSLIRGGIPHPHAMAILAAYDANQRDEEYWAELSDADHDLIVGIDDSDVALREMSLSDSVRRFLELDVVKWDTYSQLQQPEALKIRRSLEAVRQWLAGDK